MGAPSVSTESAWAWVVLGASFLCFFVALGLVLNVGILFVAFLEEFHESRSRTAWIGALQNAVFHLSGPIASFLLPYLGARWTMMVGALLLAAAYALLFLADSLLSVILVYGIMAGAGAFFALHGANAAVSLYFDKRLYVATGIMAAGAGCGLLVVGLVTEWLLETYGWRGTALLLAGLALQLCVSATLVFDVRPAATATAPATVVQTELRPRYLRDPRFWLSSLALLLTNAGAVSTYIFLKDVMISGGFRFEYKMHVVCIGAGGTVGRVIAGIVARLWNPPLYYFAVALVCSAAVFLMAVAADQYSFFVLNSAFGFCHGQLQVLQTLLFAYVYGRDRMVVAFGYAMGFGSVTSLMVPSIGGFIADHTKNYMGTIAFLSSTILGSSLCALLLFVVQRVQYQRSAELTTTN